MAVPRRILLAFALALVGLSAVPAPTSAVETVTVRGVVLGHDGRPVPGATLELVENEYLDGCPELDHGQDPVVLATTGEDGRFSLTCSASWLGVRATLPSGEFAGWSTFGAGDHDYTFRAYAGRGSISGTVYDEHGVPVPWAGMMFIGDGIGAGAYDYFNADANGRYRVDDLYPGDDLSIYAFVGDWEEGFRFTATEGDLVHDFRVSADRPSGAITTADGQGRLKVSGWAGDDHAVAKVKVAIRNRATGRWLRLNGSWGAYQRHSARMTAPGDRRTGWWWKMRLAPGSYGVSLVVVDEAGHRNPAPRPWRSVRVRR